SGLGLRSGPARRGDAVGARAEDLDGVGDVDEPVLAPGSGRPPFDFRTLHLDCGAAAAADEVMVMFFGRAAAIPDLAVVAAPRVEVGRFGQGPDLVGDRGQGDVLALRLELSVQVLGRSEAVGSVQDGGQGPLLPGRAFVGWTAG